MKHRPSQREMLTHSSSMARLFSTADKPPFRPSLSFPSSNSTHLPSPKSKRLGSLLRTASQPIMPRQPCRTRPFQRPRAKLISEGTTLRDTSFEWEWPDAQGISWSHELHLFTVRCHGRMRGRGRGRGFP